MTLPVGGFSSTTARLGSLRRAVLHEPDSGRVFPGRHVVAVQPRVQLQRSQLARVRHGPQDHMLAIPAG